MKGKIYLDVRKTNERKDGSFPVLVNLTHAGKRSVFSLKINIQKKDWSFDLELPKTSSKYFVVVKKKKLLLESVMLDFLSAENISLDHVKDVLLNKQVVKLTSFLDFYMVYVDELKKAGKTATALSYENAFNQLKIYREKLLFNQVDYNILNGFKTWRLSAGNSKSTVHTYLRKHRAVYNEAVRRGLTENLKPFEGVFNNVTVKANRTKKRNITKVDVKLLEKDHGLAMSHQRAVDLWLLMFYFGGQDLKDIYYLEHSQINKNRVFFRRGKLGENGYEFDLLITPKAQKIINKYKVSGTYVFQWRKDFEGYKSFRDNLRRSLDKVQKLTKIEVLPLGGAIRVKVARHTFATIGKQLFIEADLLRELMGHERNDVDTIYKDKYPQKIRDSAQLKIID